MVNQSYDYLFALQDEITNYKNLSASKKDEELQKSDSLKTTESLESTSAPSWDENFFKSVNPHLISFYLDTQGT
jgi:hypothetical protein